MSTNTTTKLVTKNDRPAAYYERLRARIQAGKIVTKVEQCALGNIEMSNVQFQAAKLLINKTIPDLPTPTDYDPLNGAKDISHANPHALLSIIDGLSERKE